MSKVDGNNFLTSMAKVCVKYLITRFYVIIERITSIVGPTLSILYFILRFANFMFAVDVVLRYSSLFLLFFR